MTIRSRPQWSGLRVHSWIAAAVVLVAAIQGTAGPARACALEEDVSLSRDTLNHYYPDALDVLSRVVEARRAGQLAKAAELPPALQVQRSMAIVRRFERQLHAAAGPVRTEPFAVLQIETMLWSRMPALPAAVPAELHAAGPQPGDLVIVLSEEALQQAAAGRMTLATARDNGWLRLYGDDAAAERLMGVIGRFGTATPTQ